MTRASFIVMALLTVKLWLLNGQVREVKRQLEDQAAVKEFITIAGATLNMEAIRVLQTLRAASPQETPAPPPVPSKPQEASAPPPRPERRKWTTPRWGAKGGS
mgnify:CR=1 FL=1